jgi:hypothetical protein
MSTPEAVQRLEGDLRRICGARLQSIVIYGHHDRAPHHDRDAHHGGGGGHDAIRTLVVIDGLGLADLRACAALTPSWHEIGLATPLVVATHEFERSLDAFPLEFDAILATYTPVAGVDPFASLVVDAADIRRACEVQARSHLLHLREGCLETGGRADALSMLIVDSAPAFAALMTSLARLERASHDDLPAAARHAERILGAVPDAIGRIVALVGVREIPSAQAELLFPAYLDAAEKLVAYVDKWHA